MSIEALLVDFGPAPQVQEFTADAPGLNLDSFEEGYNAGWTDATKASKDERAQVEAQIAESLKDFMFSRTEMQQQTLKELRPLIEGVLTALLPEALRPALAPMMIETLEQIASDTLSGSIVLAVPEGLSEMIEPMLDPAQWPDLSIIEDTTLSDARAEIRCGDTTRAIDLGEVQAQITHLVSEFFSGPQMTAATGTEG